MVRKVLKGGAALLLVVGVLVIADAVITLVWQEPFTSLYAQQKQDEAQGQVAKLNHHFQPRKGYRMRRAARRFQHHIQTGEGIGHLSIPAIGLHIVLIQGTGVTDLERGPGHYPSTPLPGLPGTSAIAGHRTTYLAPFRHIDLLKAGDKILLTMPYGHLNYRVTHTGIVKPTDLGVTKPVGHQQLILTSCNPVFSAAQRIVVFARRAR